MAHALVASRPRFGHRAVVLGGDRAELLAGLGALARREAAAHVFEGGRGGAAEVVYLFTGQGTQRPGMGSELYETLPLFRDALDEVCGQMDAHLEHPLREVLFARAGSPEAGLLDCTEFTQAGLFALEVALFRLLEGFGLLPDLLMGHSIGELAAAHVAGVLSLADACTLVAARGRLMGSLPPGGAMVAVQASEEEALGELAGREHAVALAALNGPRSAVFSGDEEAVLELASSFERRGRKTRRLRVSHAFHSPRMDGMLEEFTMVAAGLSFSEPRIPIVSNVTGRLLDSERARSPEYWVSHVRETVRFMDGMRLLAERQVGSFLELGPDGVLSALGQECLAESGGPDAEPQTALFVPALRAERPEAHSLLGALARLHVHGVDVDFGALFADRPARPVGLPTYAFQHERYWLQASGLDAGDIVSAGLGAASHPLLGAAVSLADDQGWLITSRLSLASHRWLADHAVMGIVLLPGTAFVDIALYAGAQVGCERVKELVLEAPLVLAEQSGVQVQVRVGEPDESGCRTLSVHSRREDSATDELLSIEAWTRNASGVLAPAGQGTKVHDRMPTRGAWPPADAERVRVDDLYDRLAECGYDYGPIFQGLQAAWRRGDEMFGEVALPKEQEAQAGLFCVHPALLDAGLHMLGLSGEGLGTEQDQLALPFSWRDISLYKAGASSLRVYLSSAGKNGVSVVVTDEGGTLMASVGSLVARPVSAKQLSNARSHHDSLFGVDWIAVSGERPIRVAVGKWAIVGGKGLAIADVLRTAEIEADVFADLVSLGEAIGSEGTFVPETILLNCTSGGVWTSADGMVGAAHGSVQRILGLVQTWLTDERFLAYRLVVVTQGAVAIRSGEDVPDLAGAPVWGLIRSAQAENPDRLVLVDLDGEESSWRVLPAALGLGEPQVAVRDGSISVPRLARAGSDGGLVAPGGVEGWRLDVTRKGTLENLSLVPSPEAARPLEQGQVRVRMRAAGLNFRDVLIALGVYPDDVAIGCEGAGVVCEVSQDVLDLMPGDRVMGLLPGAFGQVAVTDRRLLVRIPTEWSFTEAASVPIVFLTAYYALDDLAKVQRGEVLLVHAAAGGVGMAAIQLARHLGVEVFGTASRGKWGALRSLGLDEAHIAF